MKNLELILDEVILKCLLDTLVELSHKYFNYTESVLGEDCKTGDKEAIVVAR